MQVPTIVVQNTSDYADLGVATSGVSFLRTLGSSFGTAVFGTIYASTLPDNLSKALQEHPLPAGVNPAALQSVQGLHALPEAIKAPILSAYADTLQTMFLIAAPIALISLVVAFFLKEVPLRDTSRAMASGTSGIGESFAVPSSADSDQEFARVLFTALGKKKVELVNDVLARSGVPISDVQHLILMKLYRSHLDGGMTMQELSAEKPIPLQRLIADARDLVDNGYLIETDERYTFTEQGRDAFARLVETWRRTLLVTVADWPNKDELTEGINRLADRIADNVGRVGSRS